MTTKTGIIYLQRDKFQIYSPYLPAILEFRFVPELIQDFDLVNRELFENLLKVFLGNNKIAPSSMVIIVADSASFIKDFVSPPPPVGVAPVQSQTPPPTLEDLHNQANAYLEHIPFESVASKVFPLATGVRAFATNQEIYDTLKTILEKQGFIITSVLPGFVFGPNLSNRPALDAATLNEVLQKLNTLQGYNLLKETLVPIASESSLKEEPEEKDSFVAEEESPLGKKTNKKMILAVAVSAIIIVAFITGVVIYSQFQERPYKPPVNPPTPTAAPTTVPLPSPVVGTEAVKDLTVQITAPASQASPAAALRVALIPIGFKSIVPQVQTGLGSAQDLLIFSPTVSTEVRNAVTGIVKNVVPEVLVQERADAAADVVIILGE
jgi:hypothetical protein